MAFKGLRFAGLEWKNVTASKVMWVVVAAIAIIPLLYGALYLAAFQDPYARLNTVPVAVVNLDEGAVIAAEERNLGDDVVDELKDTDDGLQWHFVSAEEARSGLESGEYFMTCTIPADFSASVASVDGDSPRRAQLKISYNESENMLASQIGETVWKEVRQRMSDTVAAEYWTTVLGRVADSGKDIQTAADGADELKRGLADAHDGSGTITDNLGTLASGASSLQAGLDALGSGALSLDDGLGTLAAGTVALGNGLDALGEGASALDDGTTELAAGAGQLQTGSGQVAAGAGELAAGADDLRAGNAALAEGASRLAQQTSGLADSTSALATGSRQVSDGLGQAVSSIGSTDADGTLVSGSHAVTSGLGLLGDGLDDARTGAGQVAKGAGDLQSALSSAQGSAASLEGALQTAVTALESSDDPNSRAVAEQLKAAGALGAAQSGAVSQGLSGASEAAGRLAGGAADVASGLDTAVSSAEQLQAGSQQVTGGLQALGSSLAVAQAGSEQVADGAEQLAGAAPQLAGGIDQLSAGAASAKDGADALAAGANQVASGAAQVHGGVSAAVSGASRLAEGVVQLADGVKSAQAGSGQLADGAASAKDGASQLASGAQSAQAGASELASGAVRLEEGSAELTDGIASAEDGASELAEGLVDGARTAADQTSNIEGKSQVMNDPIELASEYYTTVKNYGTGFAPYFMALGLWVGGLVAGFVFKPLNKRLIVSGAHPVTVAFSNYLPVAFFSLIQATLLMVVLQFGLQLQIDNVPAFYGMGYLTALVFAAIMQVLMAAFGFPGKFAAIILLMLQLTACAGTFPIQTTPDFFQIINPFMPMTYVVEGMRQIMTGADYAVAGFDCLVLFAIGAACFALTCLVAYGKRTVRMDDLHPVLQLG